MKSTNFVSIFLLNVYFCLCHDPVSSLNYFRLDLESRLQILQKDLEYKIRLLQADKDKFEEKYRSLEKQRDEAFRENTRLKLLVNDSDNVRVELEKEQEKNRELYKKCHRLETDLAANNGLEQELTEINLKLKNELSFYTQEMQKSKEHIKRVRDHNIHSSELNITLTCFN